jgi:hypothetical protein
MQDHDSLPAATETVLRFPRFSQVDPPHRIPAKREKTKHRRASQVIKWAATKAQKANSFTSLAIAVLLHKSAESGELTEDDEQALRDCLSRQQDVWNVLLVIDTLVVSMTLPMLVEDIHDRGLSSGEASRGLTGTHNTVVTFIYLLSIGLVYYFTWLHMAVTSMLYIVSAYMTNFKDIIWFFQSFTSTISFLNTSLFVVAFFMMVCAAAGAELAYGGNETHTAADIVLVYLLVSLLGIGYFYVYILKGKVQRRFSSTLEHDILTSARSPKFAAAAAAANDGEGAAEEPSNKRAAPAGGSELMMALKEQTIATAAHTRAVEEQTKALAQLISGFAHLRDELRQSQATRPS